MSAFIIYRNAILTTLFNIDVHHNSFFFFFWLVNKISFIKSIWNEKKCIEPLREFRKVNTDSATTIVLAKSHPNAQALDSFKDNKTAMRMKNTVHNMPPVPNLKTQAATPPKSSHCLGGPWKSHCSREPTPTKKHLNHCRSRENSIWFAALPLPLDFLLSPPLLILWLKLVMLIHVPQLKWQCSYLLWKFSFAIAYAKQVAKTSGKAKRTNAVTLEWWRWYP